ncbi:NnrS family protein [Brevundimonas sp. 2R-24]|uniref:NnrS family protein n=1 Tax=Peiella sedimenti TaxID=3061083 RepID=A0ABT8SQ86_9CAUL|nr:NnrS family protein [Caulobacteraceae bacterium XZ-24]
MGATREAIRSYAGPPLFSWGFRPFFLFSAVWAAAAVPIWLAVFFHGGRIGGSEGLPWHIHEMLFGYVGGVIAGFLLTAVPNWTGRLPVTGMPLIGLVGLWLVGRASGFLPPSLWPLPALLDGAFLIVFAAVVWREILAAKNRRNLPVALMVSLLALANLFFHARGFWPDAVAVSERAAVAVITALIALIGGRIVPSFTQNWTLARGFAARPAPFGPFDRAALALAVTALALWVADPLSTMSGASLGLAGIVHFIRLVRWRGWLAWRESMVWSLHIGYTFVPVGLLLLGGAALAPSLFPFTAGLHALTAGAMGVMTLAVMTRASRGHTGRPRASDPATTGIYILAVLAAAARIVAPFLADWTPLLLSASALLWILAFSGFVLAYGPMLLRRSL